MFSKRADVLAKRADVLALVMAGLIILGLLYIGVEQLWIIRGRALNTARNYANQLNQCRANLKVAQTKALTKTSE